METGQNNGHCEKLQKEINIREKKEKQKNRLQKESQTSNKFYEQNELNDDEEGDS